jgi:phasin family protein
MYNEMLAKMFNPSLISPVVKFNKMAVANLEKIVHFQRTAMQSYVNIGFGQLKAAAEITNPQDLQAFLSSQVQTAVTLRLKMLDDLKSLADITTGFKTDLDKVAQENVSELTRKSLDKAA